MKTVCALDRCTGCMACTSACARGAIDIVDNIESYNAVINADLCVDCGKCYNVCQVNNPVEKHAPMAHYQGWASDNTVREAGSSGGVASAIGIGFVKSGGVVCSCVFENGEFGFEIVDTIEGIKRFAGSKYVKSNPQSVYKKLKEYIKNEKNVLFIGLPCQVAAVKKFCGESQHLYTVDLICHGTPSPQNLAMYLSEKGYDISTISGLKFRIKNEYGLSCGGVSIEPPYVRGRYTMAFLRGLTYTENCYSCGYAELLRASDITLGDSWGSDLEQSEVKKGISLVLCQTEKGQELLDLADVYLCPVDINNAVANNQQLAYPAKKPQQRSQFLTAIKKRKNFSKAISLAYPKDCFRQYIKAVLGKLGLLKVK